MFDTSSDLASASSAPGVDWKASIAAKMGPRVLEEGVLYQINDRPGLARLD